MYVDTAMSGTGALALPYEASMHILDGGCNVKKPRWNTTPRRGSTTRWTWAWLRAWQLVVPVQTAILWRPAAGHWRTGLCLPTQPLRHPPRACCAGRCWRVRGPVPRWSKCALATGIRWAVMPPARLRTAVFVRERGIPADVEADALDARRATRCSTTAWGMPVATGRLLQQRPAWAASGAWRWTGGARCQWGRVLLAALVDARAPGRRKCNCTRSAAHKGSMSGRGSRWQGSPYEETGLARADDDPGALAGVAPVLSKRPAKRAPQGRASAQATSNIFQQGARAGLAGTATPSGCAHDATVVRWRDLQRDQRIPPLRRRRSLHHRAARLLRSSAARLRATAMSLLACAR